MALIWKLPGELLTLIFDAYVQQDWNDLEDGDNVLEKRLVCKTFDALICKHAFKKLDLDHFMAPIYDGDDDDDDDNDTPYESNHRRIEWLLYTAVLSELSNVPANALCSTTPKPWLENYCLSCTADHGYIKSACAVAASYHGYRTIGERIDAMDRKLALSQRLWPKASCNMLPVAAYVGDYTAASLLVSEGSNVNLSDDFLGPPLYAAANKGRISIVRLLLDHQADPNVAGFLGTPLHIATKHRNVPLVDLLLKYDNIDPNCLDRNGVTPLWFASFRGQSEIVRLLLTHKSIKVDLKCEDEIDEIDKITPLAAAIQEGCAVTVQMLLARTTKRFSIDNAVDDALRFDHVQVLQLLLTHAKKNVCDYKREGHTLLWWAIMAGAEGILEMLLANSDINPNAVNEDGHTPLWVAINQRNFRVVERLLQRQDFNPNQPLDAMHPSPLCYASETDHWPLVELLIKHPNIDVNVQDRDLNTPAIIASLAGHSRTLEILLQHGQINLALQNNQARTALMCAVEQGHEGIVRLILQHNSGLIDMQNTSGSTCLMCAVEGGHYHIIQLLLEYNPNVWLKDRLGHTAWDYSRDKCGIRSLFQKHWDREKKRALDLD